MEERILDVDELTEEEQRRQHGGEGAKLLGDLGDNAESDSAPSGR